MSGNDLDAPLGYAPDSDASRAGVMRDIPWGALALSGMGLIAVSLVAFVRVTDEGAPPPRALASLDPVIAKRITVPDLAPSSSPVTARNEDATSTIGRTIRTTPQNISQEGGVNVVRRSAMDGSESIIIRVPDDVRASLAPAPDPRLIAPGPHGALPRIGRDGARPADVYARPVMLGAKIPASAPRIAIVVTGMGLNPTASEAAVEKLPPAVTLAFAPYGENIEDQAEQARAAGHELLLQAPMEGFADTPSAGPRTLAANAPKDKTLDALHWHMSRFPGYVGVTNFLGARFMSAPQAFAPVMQDLADRGLLFLDDGTSQQSLTPMLAAATGAQAARADIVIDASSKPEAIDAALRRLESLARERGSAIGVASALPQTVDRIARFTQGLEARGVGLTPVSALIQAPARTSAR